MRAMAESRLYLGYETAFWIWRMAGPLAFSALTPTRARSLVGGAPSASKIKSFRSKHPDLTTESIDVLVKYGDQRNVPGVRVHTLSNSLPDRTLYQLDDDTYVVSPELCLLQLATKYTEPEVVKLALEMCGTYAVDPYASIDRGFYDTDDPDERQGMAKRPPLTSRSKLDSLASRMFAANSRARRTHFLRYVTDGSASPRETALCMLLCMAPRFGGYGFKLPELNQRIELEVSERLMVGVNHFDCDMYWPNERVAVEYDSKLHHSEAENQERDAIRRNMLEYKNIRVITATRKQLNSPGHFNAMAQQIASAIGKRTKTPDQHQIAARMTLRDTAFNWDLFNRPPM